MYNSWFYKMSEKQDTICNCGYTHIRFNNDLSQTEDQEKANNTFMQYRDIIKLLLTGQINSLLK